MLPAAVHDAAWESDESGADGALDGQFTVGGDATEAGAPADQVVGEHRAREPCRVGEKLSGGDAFETGTFFEVADREFDDGVVAVELVEGNGVAVEVGQERVVAPVGPERCLCRVNEAGAAARPDAGATSSVSGLPSHSGGCGGGECAFHGGAGSREDGGVFLKDEDGVGGDDEGVEPLCVRVK